MVGNTEIEYVQASFIFTDREQKATGREMFMINENKDWQRLANLEIGIERGMP